MKKKAELIIFAVLSVLSLFLVLYSLKYQYYINGIPGPGFVPFWISLVMFLYSLTGVFRSFRSKHKKLDISREELNKVTICVLIMIISIIMVKVLGLIITVAFMTSILVYFFSERKIKSALYALVISPTIIYVIFELILKVNFPKGFLGV